MDFDRWFASQKAPEQKPEPNWYPDEWLGDQHPDKQEQLMEMRGGCRCFLAAPCGACAEPITDDEARELELVPHAATSGA